MADAGRRRLRAASDRPLTVRFEHFGSAFVRPGSQVELVICCRRLFRSAHNFQHFLEQNFVLALVFYLLYPSV